MTKQLTDPKIVTFGCRLNTYESEVMRQHAREAGLSDTIIFNTCAVTTEAERQARQSIRKARRDNPDAKIIVTGCAAQINPEAYASMQEVDHVLGNEEKLKRESFDLEGSARVAVNDIMEAEETAAHLVHGFEEHTRAFVQIQQGCNHRCTFCIIPFGRGNNRSVPIGAITEQVRTLVDNGVKEVVLTGVDITDYGLDLPGKPTLGQMTRRLLALVPGLKRLRLSSLDPVEIDEDTYRLIAEEPRLMPHLHISLQAGDDMVLKRMKRRHLRQDVVEMVNRARALRPDVVFGADIIAGFPTESDEMFENTFRLVEELGLTYLHVFPYSERPGTPAAKMPQVPGNLRKERAARLRSAGEAAEQLFLHSRVGKTAQVLVEKNGFGRCEHYAPIQIEELEGDASGEIVPVYIAGIHNNRLLAYPLGSPAAKAAQNVIAAQ
ncbi:tRNA (N(6)-L-threonylcarbamoyladenosine(37)-C(2))-methylthiotransferase MtaB [Kiloniella laminariae]|uniref:tRNA (N(6)-L-threonylcarbamoyladenosine(37)-C(2))-methylthiotransferase MtaB n=1 Tax=Kiloniella laminariae TaxID=454162 RepID=A0ABT4LMM7_9PROT|nr:tRNA (N(6)-L-threonylcarbamoyladenosine(37)-C(2))-methylthiotransferase MtaB [Kiloniella laminariae]MCZ4282395.1 tRNA (N(6)-L-threonylcarbamoyladenosine(37)-C(2))-methylthiotransferase MtaB [Kiloniella laminariae]